MNFLNIHPKYRPLASIAVGAICIAPIAFELHNNQQVMQARRQATEQAEQAISQSKEKTERDERIALSRAEKCLLIDEKFPLVEGGKVFYDPKMRKDSRLLPEGTKLCSKSGITAVVDEAGQVSTIKQAPIEKINQVLKQRGLI